MYVLLSLEKIQNFIFCLRVTKTTYRTDQKTQNDKRKCHSSHKKMPTLMHVL